MPYEEEMIRFGLHDQEICRREKSALSQLGLRGLFGRLKKLHKGYLNPYIHVH